MAIVNEGTRYMEQAPNMCEANGPPRLRHHGCCSTTIADIRTFSTLTL